MAPGQRESRGKNSSSTMEILQNSTINSTKAVDEYIFGPKDPYIDDGHVRYIITGGDNRYTYADVDEEFEQLIKNSGGLNISHST